MTHPRWEQARRPITAEERPYLETMGAELKRLRQTARLTGRGLAYMALVSQGHVWTIEAGRVRTRKSTLSRIAVALVAAEPDLGTAEEITERLATLAGPGLAAETQHEATQARRLRRRERRRERGEWTP